MYDEFKENFRVYKGHELRRTDPYGHWVIPGVSGVFTNTRDALIALERHLEKPEKKKRGK